MIQARGLVRVGPQPFMISSAFDDARTMGGEALGLWKRKKLAKYIGHCGVLPRGGDPRLR